MHPSSTTTSSCNYGFNYWSDVHARGPCGHSAAGAWTGSCSAGILLQKYAWRLPCSSARGQASACGKHGLASDIIVVGGFAFGAVGSWELSMVEHPCRVVVEGWRRLPHSYSIVATYFYHHLGQSLPAHCEILFYDVPYWNPNWEPITNRYLYDKLVESSMANMKSCNLTTWRNVTVRIAFPYNVNSREEHCQSNNEDHAKGKVLVIGTAEFMSVNDSIYWANAANNNLPAVLESINQQYNNNIIMVTHSSWSRAGFINAGISPRKIRNVPLGVDHNVYYGLSKSEKVKWRVEILNRTIQNPLRIHTVGKAV